MAILFFKILYGVYFGGVSFYFLHLLSMLLFGKLPLWVKIKRFVRGMFISIAWPIMILSSGGIDTLRKSINKF